MYKTKQPTDWQLAIRHYPWLQKCIGLILVTVGLYFACVEFPHLIILRCDRSQNLCTLEQSNLFRVKITSIPLQDVVGAKLEEIHLKGKRSTRPMYKIWILMRHSSLSFTPFGIGTAKEEKEAIVSEINAYLKKTYANKLEVVEDERSFFYPLSAGFFFVGILVLYFIRSTTCILDKAENRFLIKGNNLWGFKKMERSLSELTEIFVVSSRQTGYQVYQTVFKFTSGVTIPLTYFRYLDNERQQQIVKEIKDFLK